MLLYRQRGWVTGILAMVFCFLSANAWADPPAFVSSPQSTTEINEDALYTDTIEVTDIKGHSPLAITLQAAPTGMTISSTVLVSCTKVNRRETCTWRATVSWTPTNDDVKVNYNASTQKGTHSVTLRATDQKFNSFSDYSYKINVKNVNDAPTFTTVAGQKATEDQAWTVTPQASDIDPTQDKLTYSIKTAPAGVAIDKATGKLTWTPVNDDVGTHSITIRADDGNGGSDETSFTIVVANTNDSPVISSSAPTGATKQQLYTYSVQATDPDPTKDTLTYTLTQKPGAMSIDSGTGLIKWTPSPTDINKSFNVSLEVTDGNGGKATQAWVIKVVGANDAPIFTSNPPADATEDQKYTYTVTGSDANTDPLAFSLSKAPAGMTIQKVNNTSATITWTPTNAQVGPHAVVIQVDDGRGGVGSQTYTVTVKNTNDAPTFTSTPVTVVDEDSKYEYKLSASDIDPTQDKLTYSLVTGPKGMLVDGTLGVVQWSPDNSSANQKFSVTVKVDDGNGGSDTQSFQVEVRNTNDNPVFSSTPPTKATEDSLLKYTAAASDPDPTQDKLSYRLVSGPSNMKIDAGSGILQWTPNNDDAVKVNHIVTLEVTDGNGGKATQTFTIAVTNVNDAPEFTSTPVTGAVVGQTYQYDADAVDPDPTGDTLTFSFVSQPQGMAIDPKTGIVTWTPKLADTGNKTVEIKVADDKGASSTQKFTLAVIDKNIAPTITSTPTLTATEDKEYTYEVKAADADQDTLTYIFEQGPSNLILDKTTGLLKWTPLNEHVGTQVIQLRVEDGRGGVARQRFSVVVANVNDNPVISSNPPLEATEDALYSYNVKASDVDPTQDTLEFALVKPPTGMKIDKTTGVLQWTPDNKAVGSHVINIEVKDDKGGKTTQTYTLVVKNVNDAPKFSSQPILKATEDQLYQYRATATDEDPTKDSLTFALVLGPTDKGLKIDPNTGLLQWTPTNEHVGSYKVELRVTDGNGGSDNQTFTLVVENVNDNPQITSTPPSGGTQGKQYKYDVKAVDVDPTKDKLSYKLTQTPSGGTNTMQIDPNTGALTWTPEQVHVGNKHLVTVEVTDGNGGKATQSWLIEVFNSNDLPSFSEKPTSLTATEDKPFQYQAKATDPDKDNLLFRLLQNPKGMQMSPTTGLIQWTPTNDDAGTNHVVIMQVDDQKGGTANHTFSVNVANVNDNPTITSTPLVTAVEKKLYTYDVDASDIDPTKDTLTFKLETAPTGMTINATSGLLQWTPTNADVGAHPIKVTVEDGNGGSESQSFTVTVANVNDDPTITTKAGTEAIEDQQYLYLVKANDPDPTKDSLTFSLETAPKGMTIDPSTGLVEWTPTNDDADKQHAVKIKVEDGNGGSATESYFLQVKNVNDDPTITSQPVLEVTMDETYSYNVKANDIDPTNDKLTFVLIRGPQGLTLDKDNGLMQWKTTSLDVGEHDVEVVVEDDKGGKSKPQLYKLTVKVHPDSPVANAGPALFRKPNNIQLDGSASTDPKGQPLKYEWTLMDGPDKQAKFDDPTAEKPSIILRRVGVYRIRLVVENGAKKSPPAFTNVTIQNVTPFAHAGWNKASVVGQEVVLDASRSDDSNGDKDQLKYEWKQLSGPQATLDDATAQQPKFTPSAIGSYEFQVVVSDDKLQSEPSKVWIVVYDPAQKQYPPHPFLQAPASMVVNEEITLDARRSRSFTGKPLKYVWTVLSGPETQNVIPSSDQETVTFKPTKAGNYRIQVIAKDGDVSSSPIFHNIQVLPAADKAMPKAEAKSDYVPFEANYTLDSSSSKLPDGATATYAWTQISGPPVELKDADKESASFFVLNKGTYRFQLLITLDDGTVSAPSVATLQVNSDANNKPPVSKPSETQQNIKTIKAGEATTLDGSQSVDPEGKPLTYQWRQVSGIPLMIKDPNTVKPSITPYAYGRVVLELVVSDGVTSNLPGATILLLINDETNSIPVADAGPDQTVLAGVQITLDGSASKDEDGDTLTYKWRLLQPDGVTVTLDTAEPAKPTFTIPSDTKVNEYLFGLVVDDGKSSSLEDVVIIKVDGVNEAPKAVIANVSAVEVGATVNLDGSGSTDPNPGDKDKLTYAWKHMDGPKVEIQDADKAKASFKATAAGTITVELTVSDGTLDNKTTVKVVVNEPTPPAPEGCGCETRPQPTSLPIWMVLWFVLFLFVRRRQ